MAQQKDVIGSADDPIRRYTKDEEILLTANLMALSYKVRNRECSNTTLSTALICALHAGLFNGVRSHAGKVRRKDFGSEFLVFGPNRSPNKNDVPNELDAVFLEARKSEGSILANPNDPNYERSALYLAVWVHAEVIRIHPFEDGNGRIGRLLMGEVLIRLGFEPIPVEAHKEEYYLSLNHYLGKGGDPPGNLQLLLDLLLRIAADFLDESGL